MTVIQICLFSFALSENGCNVVASRTWAFDGNRSCWSTDINILLNAIYGYFEIIGLGYIIHFNKTVIFEEQFRGEIITRCGDILYHWELPDTIP